MFDTRKAEHIQNEMRTCEREYRNAIRERENLHFKVVELALFDDKVPAQLKQEIVDCDIAIEVAKETFEEQKQMLIDMIVSIKLGDE